MSGFRVGISSSGFRVTGHLSWEVVCALFSHGSKLTGGGSVTPAVERDAPFIWT